MCIRDSDDAVLRAERARLPSLQERRQLDLVDRRDLLRLAQQLLEVPDQEVAHADRPRAPLLVDPLERPPGLEPLPGDGPVKEVKVDVVEAEPLQARVERALGFIVA